MGHPSTKCQNFTVLFFGMKISATKHEIMPHAVSLNLTTLVTAFTA